MQVTKEQSDLIIGTVLGDGFLQKRGQKTRLRICHSFKQREYVDWKYKKLQSLCVRTQIPKKVTQNSYQSYLFSTQSDERLSHYHNLFYEQVNGRYQKIIRPELALYLTDPLSLAIWWMDDGSARTDCYAGRFATQSYTLSEHKLLQDILMRNYCLKTSIVRHTTKKSKVQYTLSVPSKGDQFARLVQLIRPFVTQLPCMIYKLGKPRND